MAIETGTAVRTASPDKWKTWGWINMNGEIRRALLEPDRIYTVTIASSRFKKADGTYQSVTKMTCPVTGVELMAERSTIVEDM
jgi:hypothetical protein